jgi:hypothetical protein
MGLSQQFYPGIADVLVLTGQVFASCFRRLVMYLFT